MVNNPTFNYGEFATVNLNNAIKLGNRKIVTSNLENKGIFIFNISPSPSVGALPMSLADRAQVKCLKKRSSNYEIGITQ